MKKSNVFLIVLFVTTFANCYAQCAGFPSTTADEPCEDYFPLANNNNINGGQSFGVCGESETPPNYSNINLGGGVLRVCSDTRISGNFNSGTIVVACGATLTFNGSVNLNSNIGIVNYGTVIINGTLNYQNSNTYFYNESTTSRLFITGNISCQQNSGQNAFLKNNGFIQIDGTFGAREGLHTCLGSDSKLVCYNLQYLEQCNNGPHNRFTYAGGTDPGIIQYKNNATIQGNFTSSSSVHVFRSTTANAMSTSNCSHGSWGSATVSNNTATIAAPSAPPPGICPVQNCYTSYLTLPVQLISFQAEWSEEDALISWTTLSEENNSHFNLLRSADAEDWEVIGQIDGLNSSGVNDYSFLDEYTLLTDNFYRLQQFDFDGNSEFSNVIKLTRSLENFMVYPNPANDELFLVGEHVFDAEGVRIYDMLGRDVTNTVSFDIHEKNTIKVDVTNLSKGVYVIGMSGYTSVFKKV